MYIPQTLTSLRPTNLNPLFSKRRTISPTSFRCRPSGFTAMKVRSFAPVHARISDHIFQKYKRRTSLMQLDYTQTGPGHITLKAAHVAWSVFQG